MKWEYIILDAEKHNFNSLGKVGYELVAVDNGKAYFKRLVKDVIEGEVISKGEIQRRLDLADNLPEHAKQAVIDYYGGKVG